MNEFYVIKRFDGKGWDTIDRRFTGASNHWNKYKSESEAQTNLSIIIDYHLTDNDLNEWFMIQKYYEAFRIC